MSLTMPSGRPITLDRTPLGRGAEGQVHALQATGDICAKIYYDPDDEIDARVDAMVRHPASQLTGDHAEHVHAAWPLERLIDSRSGRTRGFLMPRVEGVRLPELYDPGTRLKALDYPTWRTQLEVAGRAARLLGKLHEAGVVVGDISPANLMVGRAGHVTLIDCDTVQLRDSASGALFGCRKLTPRYRPPGSRLAGELAVHHDEFALAVLICELLMEGEHPYDGVPIVRRDGDSSAEENIALQCDRIAFPERLVPIKGAMPDTLMPPAVRRLAVTCFGPGHGEPTRRPAAQDWAAAISTAGFELMGCRINPNHSYHRSLAPHCIWCRRAAEGLGDSYPTFESIRAQRPAPEQVPTTSTWPPVETGPRTTTPATGPTHQTPSTPTSPATPRVPSRTQAKTPETTGSSAGGVLVAVVVAIIVIFLLILVFG